MAKVLMLMCSMFLLADTPEAKSEKEVLAAIGAARRRELARVATHELELARPHRPDVDHQRRLEGHVPHEMEQPPRSSGGRLAPWLMMPV